jgi:hypothetical protein
MRRELVWTLPIVVLLSVAGASAEAEVSLSVQGCNTRCQSVQTDCVLRCDGDIPCIQECQKVADSCVDQCRNGKASRGTPHQSWHEPITNGL